MMTRLASLAFALILPAHAWQNQVNSGAPGPYREIRPVNLSYAISWNGQISSGRVNFLFGREDKRYPKHFIAQAWGGSRGVAKGLFPYQFEFTSFLRKKDLHPVSFNAIENKAKEKVVTKNIYGGSVKTTETTTPKGKKAAEVETETFRYSQSTIYDLFSAILYMRSLPLANGSQAVMVVQAFKTPYLARVKVLGREHHRGRKCIKLDLKLQKIDRDTLKLKSYKKMKKATLWLSDDAERLPMEIRSDVFIGDVRVVLDGLEYL